MNNSLFQRWAFFPNLQMELRTNEGFNKKNQESERIKEENSH